MTPETLFIPILLPAGLAVIFYLVPARVKLVREVLSVLGGAALFYFALVFFSVKNLTYKADWMGQGINFHLRLYHFSAFILLGLAGFMFLIALYSTVKMKNLPRIREYYAYIFLTISLANGAVLSDNFILLLFFWEGLLLTLFGLITLGTKKTSNRTAVKAFMLGGFCDFCMILGIGILWGKTGSLTMSEISVKPEGLFALAFVMMMIGAIGKAGAMPFHTWIPDAAIDAPVSVMAFIPAALEKLLGIYFLARITLDFFQLQKNGALAITLMVIGAATIVLAVFMALIQKDFKRLLSYHAVSQVGYMILGIGTAVPIGIAGGIFHMINHAMYKCGLFLSSGSVEHRCGTTELKKLGGLRRDMPITAAGFAVCALAISGVWPLNGFVSKEMVYHGALETGYTIFAIAAWAGAVLTFASFLKAGHSVFLGPRTTEVPKVKESQSPIFLPIVILALLCITFGVFNKLPLNVFITPILEGHVPPGEHLDFASHALSLFNPIALISMGCLVLALLLHLYGWRRGGRKAYLASEPVHRAPVLKQIYDLAEKRIFDIYEQGIKFIRSLSWALFSWIDRPIDALYDKGVTAVGGRLTGLLQGAHNGHYANYLAWCLGGLLAVAGVISWLIGI
jgi:formate hydrogenlyase subunit 3/multisubunit Na+/H+ antiporter MnhD subunit